VVWGLSEGVSELSFEILLLVVIFHISDWLNNEVGWLSVTLDKRFFLLFLLFFSFTAFFSFSTFSFFTLSTFFSGGFGSFFSFF